MSETAIAGGYLNMDQMQDIEKRLTIVERDQAVEAVHRANVEKRLAGIEGSLTWLVRLIIGGILGAVVAFAMQGGFTP